MWRSKFFFSGIPKSNDKMLSKLLQKSNLGTKKRTHPLNYIHLEAIEALYTINHDNQLVRCLIWPSSVRERLCCYLQFYQNKN